MQLKDKIAKEYVKIPEIFAELVNGFMFHGQCDIDYTELVEKDTTLYSYQESLQRTRDVLKIVNLHGNKILLGIENQSYVDQTMVIRTMLYDALTYLEEVYIKSAELTSGGIRASPVEKLPVDTKLNLVLTIVFYIGDKKWDAPISLYDFADSLPGMMEQSYIQNYKISVMDVQHMTSEDINRYSGDVKTLLIIINQPDILLNEASNDLSVKYRQTLYLLAEILNDRKFIFMAEKVPESGREEKKMCELLDTIMERGITKGKVEGKIEGKIEGTVLTLRKFGWRDEEILKYILAEYSVDRPAVEMFL